MLQNMVSCNISRIHQIAATSNLKGLASRHSVEFCYGSLANCNILHFRAPAALGPNQKYPNLRHQRSVMLVQVVVVGKVYIYEQRT